MLFKPKKLMLGITALVPPEVLYSCSQEVVDLNNFVPFSKLEPDDKLCAWSATWRELVLRKKVDIDKLIVVAGGDCYNALVDGERVELSGMPTHYFIYPFNSDAKLMEENLMALADFASGIREDGVFREIGDIKRKALEIDELRARGMVRSAEGFKIEVAGSDLMGSLNRYRSALEALERGHVDYSYKVALLGIPPIYPDFHAFLESLGLHAAYDEMPFEFIRHSGRNLREVARSYSTYTFAGNIRDRMAFIEGQLEARGIEAIIHFQQFSCHHKLEDSVLRERFSNELGYPYMTVEADLPGKTPEQVKLRLEAFAERLVEVGK